MSLRYHGNYCGPGWSGGKFQTSVVGSVEPIDEFDQICYLHDAQYATGGDRGTADIEFAKRAIGFSAKSTLAGVAVGIQGAGRKFVGLVDGALVKNMAKKSLRGAGSKAAGAAPTRASKKKENGDIRGGYRATFAPVAIGSTMTSQKPNVKSIKNGVSIRGREFVTILPEVNSASWTLGSLFPVHPAYFSSTVLGNTCRSYQKWRNNGFTIHFITRQPTSSTGQVVLSFNANVIDTCVNYNATDFLPRVLSIENSVIGPLWVNHSLRVKGDNTWRLIDCFSTADVDDSIVGEIETFVQSGVTDDAGFIVMDYDFSFTNPMYTLHSSVIPLPSASIARGLCTDATSPPVVNAAWHVNPPSGLSFVQGAAYKFVLDVTRSALQAGVTASDALKISIEGNYQNKTVADGHTFYGIAITTSDCAVHPNLTSALAGNGNNMVYRTVGAAASSWYFTYYLVQYAIANQMGVS